MSVMLCDKIQSGRYGKRSIVNCPNTWAALAVGGTAALVSAGGAYLSSQQQQQANQSIPGYQPVDYGNTIDYLNSNFQVPNYTDYTQTPYDTGYQQFTQGANKYSNQLSNVLERVNDKSNRQYRGDLFKLSPTLQGNIAQQGANTQSFLRGQIPLDVQQSIGNSTAETSLFGGYGGSQMARNLTARDLGLTSLDLMGRGDQGLRSQLGYSQALNPFQSDTLNYMLTPQQLLSQQTQQNQYQTATNNQNRTNSAQFANQRAQAIAALMAQQAQQDATGQNTNAAIDWQRQQGSNPYLSAAVTGAGTLASLYGGGGFGGSTGPANFNYSQASPYGATYQGQYNNLPVYRPELAS